MKIRANDTIVAVATPPGEGAIAVIRISGPGAFAVAGSVFRGNAGLETAGGYTVHHGMIVDAKGSPVDEVLASVFRAPHSYTGEDSVEVSCHGGMIVTQDVLQCVLAAGARQAEPGEFTRRAFINGKMDLSQAEAVAEMIRARSERARQVSFGQLQGRLGGRVRTLRSDLMDLCSLLEVDLDFSEEGIELIKPADILRRIAAVSDELTLMIRSFSQGKIAREGVEVVLAGKPNAGKSSLFNALLREERAIVTPVPGTTRDSLEESISLDGLLFKIHDTAGLRTTDDLVESEGVRRSTAIMQRADIILHVVDATTPLDHAEVEDWKSASDTSAQSIIVFNKADLLAPGGLAGMAGTTGGVLVSARTGEGVEALCRRLVESVRSAGIETVGIALTNQRHVDSLAKASECLASARQAVDRGATNEFVAFDVREAAGRLAEITGEVTSEDVLNAIFGSFCIGK